MITQIEDSFNFKKRKSKKNQIIILDTLRPYNHYINGLRYRMNGSYDKVPHYLIDKKGDIYGLYSDDFQSNILNKSAVVIAVENLGWLQRSTLAPMYFNWIGDIYRGEPYCERYKDRFFWDTYTSDQIISLRNICDSTCEKHNIPPIIMNHNLEILQPKKFNGILFRSNYSSYYTDISPAFNKELFEQLLIGQNIYNKS